VSPDYFHPMLRVRRTNLTWNNSALLVGVALCFGFSLVFLIAGRFSKLEGMASIVYLLSSWAVCGFLIYGMAAGYFPIRMGYFFVDHLRFPPILALLFGASAGVSLAVFDKTKTKAQRGASISIPLAAGLAILALASREIFAHLVFLFSSTVVAGLSLAGFDIVRIRIIGRPFSWWVLGDALTAAGGVLGFLMLRESSVMYSPPLLSGSAVQTGIVILLMLSGGFIRLGVFPFYSWTGKLFAYSDQIWRAFFLGCLNICLGGFRLIAACVMVARLITVDLTAIMVLLGLASVIVGTLLMLTALDMGRFVSGMYSSFAGALLAGVSLFSRGSFNGGLFLLFTAPALFFCSFASLSKIERFSGFSQIGRNKLGISNMPGYFLCLVICGLSLAGIPPTDGFISRLLLVASSLAQSSGGYLGLVACLVFMVSMVCVLLAFIRFLYLTFSIGFKPSVHAVKNGWSHLGSAVTSLTGISLVFFGVFPRMLYRYVISEASKAIFPPGKQLPAVVFRPLSSVSEQVIGRRLSMSFDIAAVVAAFALIGLIWYFSSSRLKVRKIFE